MAKILITGGCGYIGSHTIVDLLDSGFEVISIDNLSRSKEESLNRVEQITGKKVINYQVDLCNLEKTKAVFKKHPDIDGVIHFAAFKTVNESVQFPLMYFRNNLESLINVLECIQTYNIKNFVFSSSCSVYGNSTELPVTESTEWKEAECPYARTKQIGEQIIKDFEVANPKINAVLLRYFNPVGAHESALLGEFAVEKPENLAPIITQTAIGIRKEMFVHGNDYATRDGSCIRDYIHVMDIANAHTKALQYLIGGKNESNYEVYNLGSGNGVTVLEAIHAFEKVSGKKLNYQMGPRRDGDVEAIYGITTKARENFGWKPQRGIEDMMRTAWNWELKLADAKK